MPNLLVYAHLQEAHVTRADLLVAQTMGHDVRVDEGIVGAGEGDEGIVGAGEGDEKIPRVRDIVQQHVHGRQRVKYHRHPFLSDVIRRQEVETLYVMVSDGRKCIFAD